MDSANFIYPMRAVIRHKAKWKLQLSANGADEGSVPFDEELFQEIATTLFRSHRYREFYQQCHSREEASAIEDRIAAELIATYTQIKLRQTDVRVQALNALL